MSAAFALSAIFAGFPATAAVFGAITVVSSDCAVTAFEQNSTTPSILRQDINIPVVIPKPRPDTTSHILYSQGYEIVDVPGDGDCFFHAALVPCEHCPGWNAHTLRQQVYEEAKQWIHEYENNHLSFNEYENNHLSFNEYEGWRDPVFEEHLYSYLTDDSEHVGMTGMDAIKYDGEWMYTFIVPLVARVLEKPVILVNDTGTIMTGVNANGFYLSIPDTQLKNFDLNRLGDFVLLEVIDDNHFRGCRKRSAIPEDQDRKIYPGSPPGQISSNAPLFAKPDKTLKHIVCNPPPRPDLMSERKLA
ncbi:hypothetical protein [Endozoicomonas sp. YOMI1]|uniref:hypothetical protein n=1 Tax=Endozoicomonas sp. YOMI1 TaxID=2828739 RepID=UPI0021489151|nr:hypothetical protein [Endozoicomonas sp. YOMI1]